MTFDDFYAEGVAVDVEEYWGAGFLDGRNLADELSWTWPGVVRPIIGDARCALDMRTGEGGQLASLAPPPVIVAYEEWLPTVAAAVATLRPMGVHIVPCSGSVRTNRCGTRRSRSPNSSTRWTVDDVREERPSVRFTEIAALIGYVRSTHRPSTTSRWARCAHDFANCTRWP